MVEASAELTAAPWAVGPVPRTCQTPGASSVSSGHSRADCQADEARAALRVRAERAEADLDTARAEQQRLAEQLDQATADAGQPPARKPRTPHAPAAPHPTGEPDPKEDMNTRGASDSETKAPHRSMHSPACHTRATHHGDQRSVTATHGNSRPSDQDRRPRRSRGRSCYRSSKLVMPVRSRSPAPRNPAQVRGMILLFLAIFRTPGYGRVPVACPFRWRRCASSSPRAGPSPCLPRWLRLARGLRAGR